MYVYLIAVGTIYSEVFQERVLKFHIEILSSIYLSLVSYGGKVP